MKLIYYTAHIKTRACPGGLKCCGCLYGIAKHKPLMRRHIRRVNKHRLRKNIEESIA